MKETMKLVAVLFTITAVAAVVLGITNAYTAPIIERNAELKYQEALKAVFPGADSFETVDEDYTDNINVEGVEAAIKGGDVVGHVVKAIGNGGYGGNISFVLGIADEGEVVGYDVLAHAETPGFGASIADEEYKEKLMGITSAEEVDGITGATITTNAMARGFEASFSAVNVLKGLEEKVDPEAVRAEKIALIYPDGELEDATAAVEDENVLYAAKVLEDSDVIGYVVHIKTPMGFGGQIEFVIGIDADGKIVGFEPVQHAESEGFGAVLEEEEYKEGLVGKASADEIDGISGSTITSDALHEGYVKAFEVVEALK